MIGTSEQQIGKKFVIAFNAFAILFYAPNYISFLFPLVKIIPIFSIFMLIPFYINTTHKKHHNWLFYLLALYAYFLLAVGVGSYLKYEQSISLIFASTFIIKIVHLIVLFSILNRRDYLTYFLKCFTLFLVFIGLHAIFQSLFFSIGVYDYLGVIETQGYIFHNLGSLGFYRVSSELFGVKFLRAQSFFQEPGFLAFYLSLGVFIFRYMYGVVSKVYYFSCQFILILATTLTLSFTGIIVILIFILTMKGQFLLKLLLLILCTLLIILILVNPNEYISKSGSLLLRINDFYEIISIIYNENLLLTGLGYGLESIYTESRANNFLIEVFLYSGIFGFMVLFLLIGVLYRRHGVKNCIVISIALFYSLSTPMLWSPLVVLCIILVEFKIYELNESYE